MTNYGKQKLLDTVENMVKQSRATFTTGAKVITPVKRIERTGDTLKIYFYIPASNTSDRNLTKVEYLDEKGNVVDEQVNNAKIVRRKGFMTVFEYNYSEVI